MHNSFKKFVNGKMIQFFEEYMQISQNMIVKKKSYTIFYEKKKEISQ